MRTHEHGENRGWGRMKKVGIVLSLVLCLGVATVGPVLAHYVYNIDYTWSGGSNGNCVKARSEISHGTNDGGYSAADTWTYQKVGTINCIGGWNRPPGYLSAEADLWYWTGSQWAVCASTNTVYNTNDSWHITKTKNWSRPCGHASYYTNAGAFTYYNNAWKGGYLWSSAHYL